MVKEIESGAARLMNEHRRQLIVNLVIAREAVTADELAAEFNVSHMTIWRDLTALEKANKLRRIRGGAVRLESVVQVEPLFSNKRSMNRDKKVAIARYAVEHFVHDNDIIILEAGTTAATMIEYLDHSNLTLITNGLATLKEAAPSIPDITLMSCGGILRDTSLTFVGPQAVSFFQNLRADTFFASATGITIHDGLTDPNPLEIQVKQAMANSARRIVALIDSTKFGVRSLAALCPVTAIQALITDDGAPAPDIAQLRALGIDVHIA
jgi:DeoR/GlpR family transcriptional regulator of sugar metabolism